MADQTDAALECRNLVKIFGPRPKAALRLLQQGEDKESIRAKTGHTVGVAGVSFTVQRSEIFVIMGLSGSGKSTLVRCLNRLIEPTAGTVTIAGTDITHMDAAGLRQVRRRSISMVFQNFALFPHRTVLDNVAYGLEVQGVAPAERRRQARAALELVGLDTWAEVHPDELSGGMQQRVGLARALATDADILLMDEAFSALDPLIRREMQDELLNLQARMHKSIIFITHDLGEALRLGDRILIMRDGRPMQLGTPEEILSDPANDYVATFTQDVDRSRVLTASSVMFRPDTVVAPSAGPRVAMERMRENGLSSIFVVGRDRALKGLVHIDDAVAAVKRGEQALDSAIGQDFPKTAPDTPLVDLLPIAAQSATPIAVVDADERLLGIIVRVSVLSGLAGDDEASGGGEASGDDAPDGPEEGVPRA